MSNDEEGWAPKTAEEAFINSLVNDAPIVDTMTPPSSGDSEWRYRGERIYSEGRAKRENPYSAIKAANIQNGVVMEMPMQPYRGVLRGRLDRQAKEVRERLEYQDAAMLVVRGRIYSANSIFKVFLLFLKTCLFGLPKPPKDKQPKKKLPKYV